MESIAEELARCGLRATSQRLVVLRLLRGMENHPTVPQIHRALAAEHPSLSRKTVYEILNAFVRAGLASVITEGGEPFRYEANTEPHYHARCRSCNNVFDLPAGSDARLRGSTALPEGFDVEAISVTFRGLCARCRE